MYKNEFENKVYNEIIKPLLHELPYTFDINDCFLHYKNIANFLIKKSGLRLLKNVPKTYGIYTHTEMVLLSTNIHWRIDCKSQKTKGSNITIDNIIGEISRNTIENKLHEDKLIFVVDGNGINWAYLKKYRKSLPNYIKILSFIEFRKYIKNSV